MILGVGTDIIEVERIKASYERFGERFLNRVLHPAEIAYCLSHKEPSPYLAARFAAKEAILAIHLTSDPGADAPGYILPSLWD